MYYKEFNNRFPDELSIIEYYKSIRYPDGIIECTRCESDKTYHRKDRIKNIHCNDCGHEFSIFKNTIFEKSSTDLRDWFYAIHLVLNAKKGI